MVQKENKNNTENTKESINDTVVNDTVKTKRKETKKGIKEKIKEIKKKTKKKIEKEGTKKNKIYYILKKIIHMKKNIYFEVPVCPCCGSPITGRKESLYSGDFTDKMFLSDRKGGIQKIFNSFTPEDLDKMYRKKLNKGEIVLYTMSPIKEGKNCFCLDCGFEWKERVEGKYVDNDYIEEQKEKREVFQLIDLYNEEHFADEDDKKKNKKRKK